MGEGCQQQCGQGQDSAEKFAVQVILLEIGELVWVGPIYATSVRSLRSFFVY